MTGPEFFDTALHKQRVRGAPVGSHINRSWAVLPYYVRIRLIELQDAVFRLHPFATGIKLHSEGRGAGAGEKSAAGKTDKT
jgi:hypothetical protein